MAAVDVDFPQNKCANSRLSSEIQFYEELLSCGARHHCPIWKSAPVDSGR